LRRGEIVEPVDRHRQVDVLAFVQDLDAVSFEVAEARHLADEWPGHRTEQHHGAHLGTCSERRRLDIGGAAERRHSREHVAILFGDVAAGRAGHGSTRLDEAPKLQRSASGE
jgi:hypothetical protein